jgi:hypothetical protein
MSTETDRPGGAPTPARPPVTPHAAAADRLLAMIREMGPDL